VCNHNSVIKLKPPSNSVVRKELIKELSIRLMCHPSIK